MASIEYVYSAHSAFAYIGSERLSQICAEHNATLIHRPILLSPVVEAQNSQPFGQRSQAHVDYFFGRQIERWAEFRQVPIINYRPTFHDADYSLASGMIMALGESGTAIDAFTHALLKAHWADDADLSDQQTLAQIANGLGHDAARLMEVAASQKMRDKLAENNDWARANSVFGSPTYIVDGDPFYGQDTLELVEHTLTKPFKPTSWVNPSVNA